MDPPRTTTKHLTPPAWPLCLDTSMAGMERSSSTACPNSKRKAATTALDDDDDDDEGLSDGENNVAVDEKEDEKEAMAKLAALDCRH